MLQKKQDPMKKLCDMSDEELFDALKKANFDYDHCDALNGGDYYGPLIGSIRAEITRRHPPFDPARHELFTVRENGLTILKFRERSAQSCR